MQTLIAIAGIVVTIMVVVGIIFMTPRNLEPAEAHPPAAEPAVAEPVLLET
jgi:hypothetical protein